MPERRAKARKYTGAEIQSQVQAYARTLGLTLVRRNTGAARYPNADGTTRLVRFGRPGDLDLEGLIESGSNRGKTILVEAKATGELPTPDQYKRIMETNRAGGLAVYFDSLDVAMRVLPRILNGARVRYLDIRTAEITYPEAEASDG